MDSSTLGIVLDNTVSAARRRRPANDDAYFAANRCDWIDVVARANRLTHSVERELRQMTTAKSWTKLF